MFRRSAVVPLAITTLAVTAFWGLMDQPWRALDAPWSTGAVKVVVWGGLCLLGVALTGRRARGAAWRALGLGPSMPRGYAFGLLATAPMAVAVVFVARGSLQPGLIAGDAVLGPFAEELLFRGFLLTQLIVVARWRVPTALVITSAAFGLAHVPDLPALVAGHTARLVAGFGADGLIQLAARSWPLVAAQSAGGLLFGWVYCRWGCLWPAIGLHSCINLWWMLADGSDVARLATAGLTATGAAQAVAVALAVGLTLWRRPRPVVTVAADVSGR